MTFNRKNNTFNQNRRFLHILAEHLTESMKQILKVSNPNVYLEYVNAPILNPLVGIVHYNELEPFRHSLNSYGVYGLFIQRKFPFKLTYGTLECDTSDAAIFAVAPGQIGGFEDNGELISLDGWVLLWSPEVMKDSPLVSVIKEYRFFSYHFAEPLRMSGPEVSHIESILELMRLEMNGHEDSPQLRKVLSAYIFLILEYCARIHSSTLTSRGRGTNDILKRLDSVLEHYYENERQYDEGIPSVYYCATELAYSTRHFGELVRRATGSTAIDYIHSYIVDRGKSILMRGNNISETSTLLGFEYPHHFTRIFKKVTGLTPSEFLDI